MSPPPRRYVPHPSGTPPTVPTVTVDIPNGQAGHTTPVTVPARTPEEAFRYLYATGSGLAGEGVRDLYQGTVLEPVRAGYKARLQRVEAEIIRRRSALGATPAEGELRALAAWASRQRTNTARLWRIPQGPGWAVMLEGRDWGSYGVGGRTFANILKRYEARGLTGPAAYQHILGRAVVDDAKTTARVAEAARFFRRGGAALGVLGLGVSAYTIATAPPEQRARVAEHEAVDFAGGLVMSEAAVGLLGVGAALLAATPPGWLIIGVGLVAGIAGSYIADRTFFPEDYRPVAGRLGAGVAIHPTRRYAMDDVATHGLANQVIAPSAPLGDAVRMVVGPEDTEPTLAQRALRRAAQGAGLERGAQDAFVRRYANSPDLAPGGRTWSTGAAGFPRDGAPVDPQDFIRLRGRVIDWPLTPEQLDDLDRASLARH